MTPQTDEKTCPFCCEVVKKQALRCKHCHADLGSGGPAETSFDTTGAAKGATVGGAGHHIEGGIHIRNLTELDEIDENKKRKLLILYEGQVRDFPERARAHFALGLSYLDLHLYDRALEYLKKAIGKGSREANLHYYIALASLGGKQPRVLSYARIKEVESYIRAAIREDRGSSNAMLLWAIIKYDYYLSNGLAVPPPSIEELLVAAQGGGRQHSEARLILKHLPLPPSPLRAVVSKL